MMLSKQEIQAAVECCRREGLELDPIGAGRYRRVPPAERLVGIAYTSWHKDKNWQNTWDTPLIGTYSSLDREVIRKHAEMLYNAGVDYVWLDWSNNVDFDPATQTGNGSGQDIIEQATAIIFEEYAKLKKRPKISIFAGVTGAPEALYDGRLQKKADQIYTDYVEKYPDLFVYYKEKPLLVVYTNTPTPWPDKIPEWDDARYTVRYMTGYVSEQTTLRDAERVSFGYWSWEDRGPQTYTACDGEAEAMVATASWREQKGSPAEFGGDIPARGRREGKTLREAFARARLIGVRFLNVVSFNEWGVGEQPSVEISKDLEPSKVHGTFYLDLLQQEISRFKSKT